MQGKSVLEFFRTCNFSEKSLQQGGLPANIFQLFLKILHKLRCFDKIEGYVLQGCNFINAIQDRGWGGGVEQGGARHHTRFSPVT